MNGRRPLPLARTPGNNLRSSLAECQIEVPGTLNNDGGTPAGGERPYETRFQGQDLKNTGLFLQPPDILHDLIDILGSDAFDVRHVAKFPMVRLDAVGRRPLEGRIPVMIRLVDLMH